MRRVLVCGGRDYADRARVFAVLDELHAKSPIGTIIEGGAKGADVLALAWAGRRDVEAVTVHAEWQRDGRKAGPLRNTKMLRAGRPDLVVAFPGGPGTADMVRQARKAGVEVLEVEP